MGIGTSLFFIALAAILRFAAHATLSGISVRTIGTILLVIGVIGLLVALLWSTLWARRDRGATVVEERRYP